MNIAPAYQGTIGVVWIDLDFCKEKKMRTGQEAVRQNNSQVHTMKQLSVCCGLSQKSSPQAHGVVWLLPAAGPRRTECVLVGVTLRTSYSFGRSIIMRRWERAKRSRWGQLGEVAHWREALEGWSLSSAPSSPSPCSTAIPRPKTSSPSHWLPMAVIFLLGSGSKPRVQKTTDQKQEPK